MDPQPQKTPARDHRSWKSRFRTRCISAFPKSPLVRQLVHEPIFAVVLLLGLCVVLGVAVILPKYWDPAPVGFSKNIRVSLLDYAQAWSLRRAGANAAKADRWDDALTRYQAAVANNLADARSLRGVLVVLRDAPWNRSSNLPIIFGTGNLLLEITHTNRTDSLLIADVLERHRVGEFALQRLHPWITQLTPAEEFVWMRAQFSTGQINTFRSRWDEHPERYRSNTVLRIYRATLDAGWGNSEQSTAGLESLRQALDVPATRTMAARLLAAASIQKDSLTDYDRALAILHESDSAMAQDDTVWWDLLNRHGRTEEAQRLALKYTRVPPPTALEFVVLTRAWLNLGLTNLAAEKLKAHAERFGPSLEVWTTYLDVLTLRKDWTEVHRVAAMLHTITTSRDELQTVGLYAEVRASLAEDRKTSAREPLRKLLEAPAPNPRLALRFAAGLNAGGEHQAALHFLDAIEDTMAKSPEFWLESVLSARGRKDVPSMRRAADRLVDLNPANPNAQTIRLVSMLGARELPSEALSCSLRLLNSGTRNPSVVINHAMALLLNLRAAEALDLLSSVRLTSLTEDDANSLHVAQADAMAQLDRPAEALLHAEKVNLSLLLPPQAKWFTNLKTQCLQKTKPAGNRP